MSLRRYLGRKAEAAALALLLRAVERAEEAAQARSWRLNVLNSGVWVDLGAAQERALRALRRGLERQRQR